MPRKYWLTFTKLQCEVDQTLPPLAKGKSLTELYHTVGNFHGVQFSRMVDLYYFADLIFVDTSSAKTAKMDPSKIFRYTVASGHSGVNAHFIGYRGAQCS